LAVLVRASRAAATSPAWHYLLAVVAASMFAWLGPLSRWAYEGGMEPIAFVGWRAGVGTAALAVAIVALRRHAALPRSVARREWSLLAVGAAMGLLLNLAVFAAYERTSVGLVLVVYYTYPAMIAAIGVLTGRERVTRGVAIALGLAFGGICLVVLGGLGPAGELGFEALGFALALTAAACQTVYAMTARDGYSSIPADLASALMLGGSVVGVVLLGLAGQVEGLALPVSVPGLLPIVLLAGIVGAAVPGLLSLMAIRELGGTRTGIVMLLEPVVATVLAAALLGEALRPVQLAGGAGVLAAAGLLLAPRAAAGSDPGLDPAPADMPLRAE
jgi:drug/metabolite transporter (DMT)-like permease